MYPRQYVPQTACQSVRPFFAGLAVIANSHTGTQMDTHTQHTIVRATSVATAMGEFKA